eukprot:5064810-Amphidinium_carterae.1
MVLETQSDAAPNCGAERESRTDSASKGRHTTVGSIQIRDDGSTSPGHSATYKPTNFQRTYADHAQPQQMGQLVVVPLLNPIQ